MLRPCVWPTKILSSRGKRRSRSWRGWKGRRKSKLRDWAWVSAWGGTTMKRQILDPVAGLRIGFNIAAFFFCCSHHCPVVECLTLWRQTCTWSSRRIRRGPRPPKCDGLQRMMRMKGHSAQGQIMNIIIKHIFMKFIYSFHFYWSVCIIKINIDMLRRWKFNSFSFPSANVCQWFQREKQVHLEF